MFYAGIVWPPLACTNAEVWSLPVAQMTYLMRSTQQRSAVTCRHGSLPRYCIELLKFVDDLKAIPDRIAFLVPERHVIHQQGNMATEKSSVLCPFIFQAIGGSKAA